MINDMKFNTINLLLYLNVTNYYISKCHNKYNSIQILVLVINQAYRNQYHNIRCLTLYVSGQGQS